MDKFDYHQYACNMREHLSPKDLVVPETYEINHRYFNAKCNEYWSPEDQENLKEGIKLYETDYETINVKFFKSKKFTVELQIRAELLNKDTKEKKTKQLVNKVPKTKKK